MFYNNLLLLGGAVRGEEKGRGKERILRAQPPLQNRPGASKLSHSPESGAILHGG